MNINKNNKYLTQLTKINLIKLCSKLEIKLPKYKPLQNNKITKYKLINKINNKLLLSLTNAELQMLYFKLVKINNIKNKKLLINKILYIIKKTNKFNTISIYLSKVNNTENTDSICNNGSFGITCEYILCRIFKLSFSLHSGVNTKYNKELIIILSKFKEDLFTNYNLICIQYLGNINNSIDFMCKNILTHKEFTLSVKSNINSAKLICPQILGQCSYNTLVKYLKDNKNITIKSKKSLKYYISQNLLYFFNLYFSYLFCCDYLLWISKEKTSINYTIFSKMNKPILNAKYLKLNTSHKLWKNSNTLKYKNKSIGIFYFHNTRNVIQFRFKMNNLLQIMN